VFVSVASLVPVLALGWPAALAELAGEHLSVAGGRGCAAGAKVSVLVVSMVAVVSSINDVDLLRQGAMHGLFVAVRARSALSTSLRALRFGRVRQLDAVASRFTAGLARQAPISAAGARVTYLDIDDTARATFGYAKPGVGYGYCGVED
jgi:hypothetical protein